MRTIDADVFKAKLLKERDAIPLTFKERYGFEMPNKHGNSMRGGIRKALRCMEETPTIDAVPVVHGRWMHEECLGVVSLNGYECSRCRKNNRRATNYCPNCGALMDGE